MPGYKHSDVGVIPDDWDAVPLSQTAKRITRGASPRPIDSPVWFDSRSSVGWVRISDVTRSGRYLTETTQRLSEEGIRRSRPVPSGSLIMSICATVGRPIETRIDTCIHDGFVVFDQPSIDQSYLYHVLAALETTWSKHGQTGSQMNLNTGLINSCLIPLPPTETEQRAIAQALSDVDALLATLDQMIAKKRDIKQAAMQQLLTGETRLPGFSGNWEVKRLGEAIERIVGGGTPSRANNGYWNGSIPWVTVKDFSTFNTQQAQEYITDAGLKNSASNLIPAGTLITSTRMALGKAVIYHVDVTINQDLKALFLKPNQDVQFMRYWFEQNSTMIDSIGGGSTVKGISIQQLQAFEFNSPPTKEEQTAIATVLTDMDAELSVLEARREKTRQLKQAMMQELLTGKTRLI